MISTWASPLEASTILYGSLFFAWSTSGEEYLRPISLFIEKIVFSGFVIDCLFAIWPTRRSPLSVIATIEGVVLLPSWLGMTTGSPPCTTETQELVVPRSMPIAFPILFFLLYIFVFYLLVLLLCCLVFTRLPGIDRHGNKGRPQ